MMKVDSVTFKEIDTPIYILEEKRLRNNLSLIKKVASKADVEIILAFKAYALWKTFPIFREYIGATTASSLYEARMGFEEFGSPTHTYSPAYTEREIRQIAQCSSHLTFNSLSQYERFGEIAKASNSKISLGIRVNPEYSEVGTALYNPCSPGTRFGITSDKLPLELPSDIEGFHCHCHCESGADVFQRTLEHIEDHFSKWFPQLKWINFGGGHLMTREDYDVDLLIHILQDFHHRYPNLKVILEPGSAFGWQTGPLVSQVVDIVEDHQIRTAILNVSFTCHMPDCLEMPYQPVVRGAKSLPLEAAADCTPEDHIFRLGGNSCLSGDFMGSWQFSKELEVGDNVIFEDMLHYTTVKTCMFNGISHPSIGLLHESGELEILRDFHYDDYKNRMD
jgi:carboxynorspermidine decarboxylase